MHKAEIDTILRMDIQTYRQIQTTNRCIHTNKDRQSHTNYVRAHEQHRWGKRSESIRPHTSKNIKHTHTEMLTQIKFIYLHACVHDPNIQTCAQARIITHAWWERKNERESERIINDDREITQDGLCGEERTGRIIQARLRARMQAEATQWQLMSTV